MYKDISRERLSKFNRTLFLLFVFVPGVSFAADADFNMAAQLLSAARNGNTRLMQNLINSGADVNFVDSTGVSVVCTAVMNNDTRAVQLLQMYGADSSQCDRQIKNYRTRNTQTSDVGLFSGLSPTHKLVLGALGTVGAVAGVVWAADSLNGDGGSDTGVGSGGHGTGGGGGSDDDVLTPAFTLPYGPAMVTATGAVSDLYNYAEALNLYSNANAFEFMNGNGNYLLMMHGYSPFARGYMGQTTLRYTNNNNLPVPSSVYGGMQLSDATVSGGIPINVALITANGINAAAGTSLADRFFLWSKVNGTSVLNASNTMISSKYFNNTVTLGTGEGADTKISDDNVSEITSFDLSGNSKAIHNTAATELDNLLAKIVGGYTSGNFDDDTNGDFVGFIPNGQMTIYRTGGSTMPYYYNYKALVDAASKSVTNATTDAQNLFADYGRAKVSVIANLDVIDPLYNINAKNVSDMLSLSSADYKTYFYSWVADAYSKGDTDISNNLKQDANSFFGGLGTSYFPLTVFSVGGIETDEVYSGESKVATFENAAPLVFSGSDKLFMSVVAVNLPTGATASATSVSDFSPSSKYSLSQWQLGTGDTVQYYKSRICGTAGTGTSGVDPWCFAAAGATDEQATAAAAGAAGAVKAAFSYLSNQNIFTLLALTADGAYLGTNPSTGVAWASTDDLVAYLDDKYKLPLDIQARVDNENDALTYLDAFKQVFGYGLINLERATTPGKSIYYYSNGKIVSASGNAYWRSATTSGMLGNGVFGVRGATIPVSMYDELSSVDNGLSVARVWNTDIALGGDVSHGLYLGDTLAELKTRDENNSVSVGNLTFGFAHSEKFYDDNMSGVDVLSVSYDNERFGFKSGYQRYLTDGAGRFSGRANPVLALTSGAVSSGVELKSGRFAVMGRGFVGNITTEGLLENDPVVSNNFASAKLGDVMGAESGFGFSGEKLSVVSNVGTMHESDTVLGTVGYGFLDMNGADTNYVDSVVKYAFNDFADLTLRGTYAWTHTNDVANGIVNGMSDLKSNAFAAGVRFGNFDLTASMPLALVSGDLRYSFADFSVDDNVGVVVNSLGERSIDLTPEVREYRLNASYRHSFGDWTDGALGFIYRINPNNTNAFGNESIFMMKLSHRLGI